MYVCTRLLTYSNLQLHTIFSFSSVNLNLTHTPSISIYIHTAPSINRTANEIAINHLFNGVFAIIPPSPPPKKRGKKKKKTLPLKDPLTQIYTFSPHSFHYSPTHRDPIHHQPPPFIIFPVSLARPGQALRHWIKSPALTLANPCPASSIPIPNTTSSSMYPTFLSSATSFSLPQAYEMLTVYVK